MTTARAATQVVSPTRLAAYINLSKPDVTFLVLVTTLAGFYMGAPGPLDWNLLAATVLGTALMAAGTMALNHYVERDTDSRMHRTAGRPLPAGVLTANEALRFGVGLTAAGAALLALTAGLLPCLLGVATTGLYLGVYTPLKRQSVHATTLGSFPGALPPLIGWTAASGHLDRNAWILFAILFFWQFPHFLSIAWVYRKDYARAGLRMLPVVDETGTATFRQILVATAALVLSSLLPSVTGLTGITYFFGALVLGMLLLQICLWAERERTNRRVRWIMHASAIYLPLLLAAMMLGRIQ